MVKVKGNIWELGRSPHWIVVPTNIGWTSEGKNVMGAGIALQAKRHYPMLPSWYGAFCKRFGAATQPCCFSNLILFPVKPLDLGHPYLSWRQEASLELIERSAYNLAQAVRIMERVGGANIYVPLVGCGNGGRKPEEVLPILERHLTDERFVLVEYKK